jgi:hypothetical protein
MGGPVMVGGASGEEPSSAKRTRCFRTGQGRSWAAVTVTTAPSAVRAKREETACRRWAGLKRMVRGGMY